MKKHFFATMIPVLLLMFTTVTNAQDKAGQSELTFRDCFTHADSCRYIGEVFISKMAEKKFEELEPWFAEKFLFRGLTPGSLVTSNDPAETTGIIKKWFYVDDTEQYRVIDSGVDVLVDCLYIHYRIFETYKGDPYHVEQQLYCEVMAGKIQKLSLVCSGFRKLTEKQAAP